MSKFFNKMIVYSDFNKARFGNQLFFVAATIGIAKINNTDYSFSNQMGYFGVDYQNIFKKELPITKYIPSKKYYQKDFCYEEIITDNVELIGYFQSEKFFSHCEDLIREQYEIKDEINEYIKYIYPNISNCLSIHIRRGDYVEQSNYHSVVPIYYYKKILDEISENYKQIFVFSDDINWAKEKFVGSKYVFPNFEKNNDLYCFVLMSLAKDNIIGNSTYSWWAAWLNKNNNKKVYSPNNKQWFGPLYSNLDTKDLIPEKWIQIEY